MTSTSNVPQCQSDPFEYNSPDTVPYWDDFNGAIYEVPSIPPRHPGRTYAQVVSEGVYTAHAVEERIEPEFLGQITGESGTRGYESNPDNRRDERSRRSPLQIRRPQGTEAQQNRKRDFVPYVGLTDARFSGNPDKKTTESLGRLVLGSKDVNQKLRQEPKDTIRIATSKHNPWKNEAKPSATLQPRFQQSPVSKVKQEAMFEIPRTGAKEARPMTTLVEEPSPLKIFKKNNIRPTSNRSPSSPTLERVRRLRDLEQKTTLEKLGKQLMSEQTAGSTYDNNEFRRFGDNHARSQPKEAEDSKSSAKVEDLIPDMNISEPDWAMPLYNMANAPAVSPKSPQRDSDLNPRRRSMAATVHSVNDGQDSNDEEANTLVEATANMHVLQMRPSTLKKHRSFERKSAVPEGLDLNKIRAAKVYRQSQDNPMSWPTHDTGARDTNVDVEDAKQHAKALVESFETAESDDFERVGIPNDDGTEHNGAKRKWYKGFRR